MYVSSSRGKVESTKGLETTVECKIKEWGLGSSSSDSGFQIEDQTIVWTVLNLSLCSSLLDL